MTFSDLIHRQLCYGAIALAAAAIVGFAMSLGQLLLLGLAGMGWVPAWLATALAGNVYLSDYLVVVVFSCALAVLMLDLCEQIEKEAIANDRMTQEGDWVIRSFNGTPHFNREADRLDLRLAVTISTLLPAACLFSYALHYNAAIPVLLKVWGGALVYYAGRKVWATRRCVWLTEKGRMLRSGHRLRTRDGTPQILVDALDGEGKVWRDDAGEAYHEQLYRDKLSLLKSLKENPSRSPSLFRFN